jgi:predicted metal-dependent hydrolase
LAARLPKEPSAVSNKVMARLEYNLIRSRRRTLAIIVHRDNRLEVRCPLKYPIKQIEQFLELKADWIARKRAANASLIMLPPAGSPADFQLAGQPANQPAAGLAAGQLSASQAAGAAAADKQQRERTLQQVKAILHGFHGPQPAKVVIRRQKTRWGSCSSRGTISINSRAGDLPAHLLEYIVYHELCHLVHLNHSKDFWQLLAAWLPDARNRQKQLRQYHFD